MWAFISNLRSGASIEGVEGRRSNSLSPDFGKILAPSLSFRKLLTPL
jgi:hypothetical protein